MGKGEWAGRAVMRARQLGVGQLLEFLAEQERRAARSGAAGSRAAQGKE